MRKKSVVVMTLITAFLMMYTTSAQATGSRPMPVRERIEGSLTAMPVVAPEGRCSELALLLSYAGEGTLSRIGKVTFTTTHCSYLTPEGQPTGRYGEAEMVLVTGNGDEIHATYEGRQLDETRYLEFMRIRGGTGEFTNARGSILEIVAVDLTTFDVSIRGWGWIAY